MRAEAASEGDASHGRGEARRRRPHEGRNRARAGHRESESSSLRDVARKSKSSSPAPAASRGQGVPDHPRPTRQRGRLCTATRRALTKLNAIVIDESSFERTLGPPFRMLRRLAGAPGAMPRGGPPGPSASHARRRGLEKEKRLRTPFSPATMIFVGVAPRRARDFCHGPARRLRPQLKKLVLIVIRYMPCPPPHKKSRALARIRAELDRCHADAQAAHRHRQKGRVLDPPTFQGPPSST